MQKQSTKRVIFNTRDEAERFVDLYGGLIETPFLGYSIKKWYGNKILGKEVVMIRNTKDDMNQIMNSIGIKKKKWNGKDVYIYQ